MLGCFCADVGRHESDHVAGFRQATSRLPCSRSVLRDPSDLNSIVAQSLNPVRPRLTRLTANVIRIIHVHERKRTYFAPTIISFHPSPSTLPWLTIIDRQPQHANVIRIDHPVTKPIDLPGRYHPSVPQSRLHDQFPRPRFSLSQSQIQGSFSLDPFSEYPQTFEIPFQRPPARSAGHAEHEELHVHRFLGGVQDLKVPHPYKGRGDPCEETTRFRSVFPADRQLILRVSEEGE